MHPVEQGMDHRTVQALVVVLHHQLPVRRDVVIDSFHELQILHGPWRETLLAVRRVAPRAAARIESAKG